MFCPKCGAEFREGFDECSDCHVPLIWEKPKQPQGDPNLQLLTVLEASDPLAIASAKGILEDAGIPFSASGDEIAVRYAPIGGLIHPWCRIQVGRDREPEARTLLKPLQDLTQTAIPEDDTPEPAA